MGKCEECEKPALAFLPWGGKADKPLCIEHFESYLHDLDVELQTARAEVERLRKRTHELQEKHDKELAEEQRFRRGWGDLLAQANKRLVAASQATPRPFVGASAYDRAALAVGMNRLAELEQQVKDLAETTCPQCGDAFDPDFGEPLRCQVCNVRLCHVDYIVAENNMDTAILRERVEGVREFVLAYLAEHEAEGPTFESTVISTAAAEWLADRD